MFNRKIEMRVVKADKKAQTPYDQLPADIRLEDTAKIISTHLGELIKKTGWAVAGYVALDTLRKVAVAYATKQ
ncbi:MAG TPA: hypothetical protein VIJ87_06815 [Pyrinomonadaceae bacterium]